MQSNDPILLVEDDAVDAMTVRRALKDLNLTNEIIHAKDGEEAIEYLSNPKNKKPCIILLDINMPKMNGIEFLKEARSREDCNKIPVIMLTTSTNDNDMVESFNLNVADYIVKPIEYRKFVDTVQTAEALWRLSRLST